MTSAPAPRAICGVPSVEPPSATMMWSTRWRGRDAITAPMDSASLSVGITTATLSLADDWGPKAAGAGNDLSLPAIPKACGIGDFLFAGHPVTNSSAGHNWRRPRVAYPTVTRAGTLDMPDLARFP